jgi:hypothetical protein
LFLQFPTLTVQVIVGNDDIYLHATPLSQSNVLVSVDDPVTSLDTLSSSDQSFCCQVLRLQEEVEKESLHIDTLLQKLKDYYATVIIKRQLQMDVPAGFCKTSQHQQNMEYSKQLQVTNSDSSSLNSLPVELETILSPTDHTLHPDTLEPSSPLDGSDNKTNSAFASEYSPIIHSVDKPSSSLPRVLTFLEDLLRASVGFRRIDSIKQNLQDLYQPTIHLDTSLADAVLDAGDYATLRKKARNTTPVPRSLAFGDVLHMDIVFSPEVSIGNIHYGLLFTDRHSRMTYIYPLQNLQSDIPKQMPAFFAHLGIIPKRLITDFDLKLIGGKARDYLNCLLIHVNAAPFHHQDKNGLAERHWQTMVCMAQNWLVSAKLPSSFWFFAIRRAAEVCNYFPYKLENGSFFTPFELAHHKKPDLRVLFKLFSLSAVRRERIGDTNITKFDSQSLPMICVGRCPNSDGLQFYNPDNGTLVSSIDYVFINNTTSGARFGYSYQPGLVIYRLDETNTIYQPKFALESEVFVHTHSPPHVAKVVGIPSYDRPHIYTVMFNDGSLSEYSDHDGILESNHHLVPLMLYLYSHIGFKMVFILHSFYHTCQNQNMANYFRTLRLNGYFVLGIPEIFQMVSPYQICLQTFSPC